MGGGGKRRQARLGHGNCSIRSVSGVCSFTTFNYLKMRNIKILGEWDGEPIWREMTSAEQRQSEEAKDEEVEREIEQTQLEELTENYD